MTSQGMPVQGRLRSLTCPSRLAQSPGTLNGTLGAGVKVDQVDQVDRVDVGGLGDVDGDDGGVPDTHVPTLRLPVVGDGSDDDDRGVCGNIPRHNVFEENDGRNRHSGSTLRPAAISPAGRLSTAAGRVLASPLFDALRKGRGDIKRMFTHEDRLPLPTLVAIRSPAGHVLTALERSPRSANERDCLGWTPLHHACYHGDPQLTSALVHAGGDVDARTPDDENTPLHWACANGHLNCVAILIEAECSIEPLNARGLRPVDVTLNKDIKSILRGEGLGLDLSGSPPPSDSSPMDGGELLGKSPVSSPLLGIDNKSTLDLGINTHGVTFGDFPSPSSGRDRVTARPLSSLRWSKSSNSLDELVSHDNTPTRLYKSHTEPRNALRSRVGGATVATSSPQHATIAQAARRVLAPSNTTRWYLQLRALVTSEIFKNFATIVLVVLVEIFRAEFSAALRVLVGSLTPALNILLHFFSIPRPLIAMIEVLLSPLMSVVRLLWQPLVAVLHPIMSYLLLPLWNTLVYVGRDVLFRTTWAAVSSVGHKLFLPVLRILHAIVAPIASSLLSPLASIMSTFGGKVLARLPEIVRPQMVLLLLVKTIDVLVQQFTPSWLYSRIHTASHRIFNERYNAVAESYYTAVFVTFILIITLYLSIFLSGFLARVLLYGIFHFFPAAWRNWPHAREYAAFVGDFGILGGGYTALSDRVCSNPTLVDAVCFPQQCTVESGTNAYHTGIAPVSLRALLGIDARHHQLGIAILLLFSVVNSLVYVLRLCGRSICSSFIQRRRSVSQPPLCESPHSLGENTL
eukprot:Opistho-2@60610